MLSVLISWMIILGISLILGYGIIHYGYKANSASMEHLDIYVICGLMIVNVYAEFFSLFYKVGAKACLGLLIIGIAMCLYYHISTHGECWRIHVSGMGWYIILCLGSFNGCVCSQPVSFFMQHQELKICCLSESHQSASGWPVWQGTCQRYSVVLPCI